MPAHEQVAVDARLKAREALFLEPRDLVLREGLEGEVGERRTAPERQRLVRLALPGQPAEALEVELAVGDRDDIPRRFRLEAVWPEQLAQLRHVHLERLRRGPRRRLLPERVDQAIRRDNAIAVEEQNRKQGFGLVACDVDQSRIVAHLERTEHSVAHGCLLRVRRVRARRER